MSAVEINPSARSNATLAVYIVRDARADQVDEQGCVRRPSNGVSNWDRYSVRNICAADRGAVYCSASAMQAALEGEHAKVSPLLFYLFEHELAHIALGHPGSYTQASLVIDRADDLEHKLAQIAAACSLDQDTLALEQAADAEAFAALGTAFTQTPFADGTESPGQALAENGESAYWASRRLLEWSSEFYDTPGEFASPLRYEVCDVLQSGTGRLGLPSLGGDHPHAWRRAAALMSQINRQIIANAPTTLHGEIEDFGVSMNAMTDAMAGYSAEVGVQRFCRDVALAQTHQLDCTKWTPRRGIPEVTDEELRAAGMPDLTNHQSTALVLPSPHAYREPTGELAVQDVVVSVFASANTPDRARSEAIVWGQRLNDLVAAIDGALVQNGGYPLWVHAEPISWSENIEGGYTVAGELHWILRTGDLDLASLPAWKVMSRAKARRTPWSHAHVEIVAHFNTRDKAAVRLLTRGLAFDEVFDLRQARAGVPGHIGAGMQDLTCYAASRIGQEFGASFTLSATPNEELVLYSSGNDYDFNFDATFAAEADRRCAKTYTADPRRGRRFLRAYLAPPDNRELRLEFPRMFAAPFQP